MKFRSRTVSMLKGLRTSYCTLVGKTQNSVVFQQDLRVGTDPDCRVIFTTDSISAEIVFRDEEWSNALPSHAVGIRQFERLERDLRHGIKRLEHARQAWDETHGDSE